MDHQTQQTFTHTPMPDPSTHIRLLKFATSPKSPRILSLTTHALASAPPYTAISYTWGPHFTTLITLNGKSYRVRENCAYVLFQASLFAETDYIWIDSICIDQQHNPTEKSVQVGMMYEIYSKAARVLACIGRHENGSAYLFAVINALGHLVEAAAHIGILPYFRPIWRSLFAALGDEEVGRLHAALQGVEHRDYFKRVWILQELYAGSPNVRHVCGSEMIEAFRLEVFLAGFKEGNPSLHYDRDERSYYLQAATSKTTVGPTWEDVFLYSARHFCSDPRDRVYGLLAVLDTAGREVPKITADYTKTALELALEMVSFLDNEDTRRMLSAFELTPTSEEMKRLIRDHSQFADTYSTSSAGKQKTSEKGMPSARLYEDGRGRLRANIELFKNSHGEDPAKIKELQSAFLDTSIYFANLASENLPQQVWSGSHIAALVPAEARAGDVLIDFPSDQTRAMDVMLVLRPSTNSHQNFTIVGQGVCRYRFGLTRLGTRPCRCSPEQQACHKRFAANYEYQLAPGEKLALHGQDCVGSEYWEFDAERRLDRLSCLPLSHKSRAVSLQTVECYTYLTDEGDESKDFEPGVNDGHLEVRKLPSLDDGDDRTSVDSDNFSDNTSYDSGEYDRVMALERMSQIDRYRAWQLKRYPQASTDYQDLRQRYIQNRPSLGPSD